MLNKIPGPSTNLIFGAITQFLKEPLDYLEGVNNAYPNVTRLNILQNSLVHTCHPELIKSVLQTNQKSYVKSSQYKPARDMLGDGLFSSENPIWSRQRKLIQPMFYKQSVNGLFEIMERCVEERIEHIKRALRRRHNKLNLTNIFVDLTLKVLTESILNRNVEEEVNEIAKYVRYFIEYGGQRTVDPWVLPLWIPTPANVVFKRNIRGLQELVRSIIRKKKQDESSSTDLLSMLMGVRYEDTGEPMPEDLLVDEVNTMIVAGHETTVATLTWLFFLFSTNPEAFVKAQEEARRIDLSSLNAEKVMKATYIRNCLQEAMRMYAPIWAIGRQATEEVPFGEYTLPKGSDVLINVQLAHRHPDYWENPESFLPERWEQPDKIERFAYLPFGAGQRMCVGNHFAMLESALIVLRFLQEFDFEPVAGQSTQKIARVSLRLKDDFYMRAHLR